MEQKITNFVESTLLTTDDKIKQIVKRLIAWPNDYEFHPKEIKIETLVNEILPVYFSNELSQRFLDMYFMNVLVSNYKK